MAARKRRGGVNHHQPGRRPSGLSADERALALKLRRQGLGWASVARCVGRSIPDLQAGLAAASREAAEPEGAGHG